MAGTKFSYYLGLKHYKKAKKTNHLDLAYWPQSLYLPSIYQFERTETNLYHPSEGDGIKSRLSYQIFSTLTCLKKKSHHVIKEKFHPVCLLIYLFSTYAKKQGEMRLLRLAHLLEGSKYDTSSLH